MLSATIEEFTKIFDRVKIIAKVKQKNLSSQKILSKVGFKKTRKGLSEVEFSRNY